MRVKLPGSIDFSNCMLPTYSGSRFDVKLNRDIAGYWQKWVIRWFRILLVLISSNSLTNMFTGWPLSNFQTLMLQTNHAKQTISRSNKYVTWRDASISIKVFRKYFCFFFVNFSNYNWAYIALTLAAQCIFTSYGLDLHKSNSSLLLWDLLCGLFKKII